MPPRRFKGKPVIHEQISSLIEEGEETSEELWKMQVTLGEEIMDDFEKHYKETARTIFFNSRQR